MTSSFNPQSEIPNPQLLRLFVYGTLKRGFWNHDRFCRGVLAVEDAVVRGRLFETSSGIPVLKVPEEDILAVGTTNPLADVATQAHVTARMSNPEPTPDRLPNKGTGAPWGPVYGELLTFDNPENRLPATCPAIARRAAADRPAGGVSPRRSLRLQTTSPSGMYCARRLVGGLAVFGNNRSQGLEIPAFRQMAFLTLSRMFAGAISLAFRPANDITYAIKFEQKPEVCRPDDERFTEWIMKIQICRPW